MKPVDKGPIRILCDESGYEWMPEMETPAMIRSFCCVMLAEIADIVAWDSLISRKLALEAEYHSTLSRAIDGLHRSIERAVTLEDLLAVHEEWKNRLPRPTEPVDRAGRALEFLTSVIWAIPFAGETPCRSRHLAGACGQLFDFRYQLTLHDSFTNNWKKEWCRHMVHRAVVALIVPATLGKEG